jgi:2-polyprenyl-3-methyl-5-hydroxy-6-metoxy-1,4-benzoquinol methylase
MEFLAGMTIVSNAGSGRRFLDVGSGIGTKLALASSLEFDVHGIECYSPYIEVSKRLFPDLPVTHCTAEVFDRYDRFDVVYCYRPCVKPEDQNALNRHISERMRSGALLFNVGGPSPLWLEHVDGEVWRV